LSNFKSFGPTPTQIDLPKLGFLIGPNGCGKTAVLQALCRLFSTDPKLRYIDKSDFHIALGAIGFETNVAELFLEAHFDFPELAIDAENHNAIPPFFGHMRLESADQTPKIIFRLEAKLLPDDRVDECLYFVVQRNEDGSPRTKYPVSTVDRANIQVHYIPARRNPADHVRYSARSMIGRVLRAADWSGQNAQLVGLTRDLSSEVGNNPAVARLAAKMGESWRTLHRGDFLEQPHIRFNGGTVESLLRSVSVAFTPSHGASETDVDQLSDGEQSLLYLSLVVAIHDVGQEALGNEGQLFDTARLAPPIFTIIAMEEPENSLSPHYLGRIASLLNRLAVSNQSQALLATHAPALLRRVDPEHIRYLRLNTARCTTVSSIELPNEASGARQFVREAVQSFPELYFSRLVVLGEGDSEEILLPRLLQAKGLATDIAAVSVAPLGGRHVHHFWRLLSQLGIPHVTLLDLDLGRHLGGWGRIKYVCEKLLEFYGEDAEVTNARISALPLWNDFSAGPDDEPMKEWLEILAQRGVFFASPLDLDFAMLEAFPAAFGFEPPGHDPTPALIKSVLGDSASNADQYSVGQRAFFSRYHALFKLRSKPAAHLTALARLADDELIDGAPQCLKNLVEQVEEKLERLPA
jgi:putative ATP-dependent endonuclease of OLD family